MMRSCTFFPHVGKCQRSTNIHFNEVIICPGRIRIRYENVTYDVAGAVLTFCYVNYIYYHMLIEKMSDSNEDHTSLLVIRTDIWTYILIRIYSLWPIEYIGNLHVCKTYVRYTLDVVNQYVQRTHTIEMYQYIMEACHWSLCKRCRTITTIVEFFVFWGSDLSLNRLFTILFFNLSNCVIMVCVCRLFCRLQIYYSQIL